jgi:hypothetical protein
MYIKQLGLELYWQSGTPMAAQQLKHMNRARCSGTYPTVGIGALKPQKHAQKQATVSGLQWPKHKGWITSPHALVALRSPKASHFPAYNAASDKIIPSPADLPLSIISHGEQAPHPAIDQR